MVQRGVMAAVCAVLLAFAARVFAQDATLVLDLPRPVGSSDTARANPREEDHALALYREDEWNRALVCPEARAASQPADEARLRCAFAPTTTLPTGPIPLVVGLSRTTYDHDGMYGIDEDVVITARGAAASETRVIATLTQLTIDVVDSATTFRMRRQRVLDLDHDGTNDLCIESVEETGPGLFEVLRLGRRPFRPMTRTRGVDAWSVDESGTLVRRPALDGRCPSSGYRSFVEPNHAPTDPVERRRVVQGERRSDVRAH